MRSMCWGTIPPDKGNLVLTYAFVGRERARAVASRAWERRRALGAGGGPGHGEQQQCLG